MYTFRSYFRTFHGAERLPKAAGAHPHDATMGMLWPMAVLAVGSLVLGAALGPTGRLEHYFEHVPYLPAAGHGEHDMFMLIISSLIAIAGVGFAWWTVAIRLNSAALGSPVEAIAKAGVNRFYLDEIYSVLVVKPLEGISRMVAALDVGLIDEFLAYSGRPAAMVGYQNAACSGWWCNQLRGDHGHRHDRLSDHCRAAITSYEKRVRSLFSIQKHNVNQSSKRDLTHFVWQSIELSMSLLLPLLILMPILGGLILLFARRGTLTDSAGENAATMISLGCLALSVLLVISVARAPVEATSPAPETTARKRERRRSMPMQRCQLPRSYQRLNSRPIGSAFTFPPTQHLGPTVGNCDWVWMASARSWCC